MAIQTIASHFTDSASLYKLSKSKLYKNCEPCAKENIAWHGNIFQHVTAMHKECTYYLRLQCSDKVYKEAI